MTERGFFEPDVLITEQLVTARRRRAALSSEKRLMLAVLENAVHYYGRYFAASDRLGHALFTEAKEWIASTSNEDIFSFESISETLDINPNYFRRGIAAWHQRLLQEHARPVGMPVVKAREQIQAAR